MIANIPRKALRLMGKRIKITGNPLKSLGEFFGRNAIHAIKSRPEKWRG